MNKYIFPIMAAFAAILTACVPEDLPKADYNRAQVKDFVAIPGDREVTLSWSSYDNFAPDSYYVTWGNDADTTLTDTTLVVKELENGTKYTFTIQADYDDYGLSGQVSLECTPVTSRIAISDVVATTGDGTVHFEWSKPADNVAGYTLTWSLAGETAGSVDIAGSETSVAINDLTNYKNYTFVFVAHYPNGDSDDTSIKAMPSPGRLYTVNTTNPGLGAEVNLNIDEGVPDGNVVWNFDDGTKMAGRSVCHRFMTSGNHKVTLVVTFSDSDEIDVEIEFVVRDTYFYNEDYQIATGSYNGLKAQAPVFSPDGKTVYAATFNSPAGLYAFDIMTSTLKWSYICQSQGGAYGCSPVVDPNSGVIYFGTSTSGEFYALNPDGTLRWSNSQMKSVNKSYPAIGSDGTVYVMDSGNTLYALSPNDGSVKWSMELSDAGGNGGILVNETGISKTGDGADEIIVGTKNYVYFITTDGSVKTDETIPSNGMTAISCFTASIDHKTIYYSTQSGRGLYSVDLATHTQSSFTDPALTNNAYNPVTGPDGTIYFGCKTSSTDPVEAFFAVNPDMTKKWGYTVAVKNAFNFCFPSVDALGNVYAGMNDGSFLEISDAGSLVNGWSYSGGTGFMGGTNYCDGAVFSGKVGSKGNNGGLFGMYIGNDRASSWCSRGGDICGSSCLK